MPWGLSPADFHAIVSGRRRGWRAAACRSLLGLAEWPYGAAVRWRNHRFDRGHRETYAAGCPVVSVGNITLGGVGKTPMIEWLARWLRARQVRVAILSRGYGAEAGAQNDEALELEEKLPDVPHLLDPNRSLSARIAVEELAMEFLLLDDAFQHRRLKRDLDLVLIDALEPFGYDHLFPRGALREPLSGLARAQIVGLSRADAVSAERRAEIQAAVRRHAPAADWLELAHQPLELIAWRAPPVALPGKRGLASYNEPSDHGQETVAAICGIGNPTGFRHTLASCGFDVVAFREFPDHHPYGAADVASLAQWIENLPANVERILCTHKDLVKLQTRTLGGRPLLAVRVGMHISQGQARLEQRLEELLARS